MPATLVLIASATFQLLFLLYYYFINYSYILSQLEVTTEADRKGERMLFSHAVLFLQNWVCVSCLIDNSLSPLLVLLTGHRNRCGVKSLNLLGMTYWNTWSRATISCCCPFPAVRNLLLKCLLIVLSCLHSLCCQGLNLKPINQPLPGVLFFSCYQIK